MGPTSPRRPLARVAAVIAALLVASLVPARGAEGAQSIDEVRRAKQELEAERAAVRADAADNAAEVDALVADVNELRSILAGLEEDVAAKEALADEAERRAGFALDQVTLARLDAAQAADEERDLRGRVRDLAVQAYVAPDDVDVMGALVEGDWLEGSRRAVVLDVVTDRDRDLVDSFRVVAEDLAERQARALAAEVEAEEAVAAAEEAVAAAAVARDEQAGFVAEVEARLDHALSEAASLESIDAELAAEIRSKEGEIASLIEEQQRAAAAAAAAAAARSGRNAARPSLPASGDIVNAGGILVHASIARNVTNLLAAAAADGVVLGGGGWRSSDAQVSLRRSHCGSSEYAVWSAPSSSCRPPTARPGQSNHERGLAIDFTHGGRAINTRRSPAYQWLAANAAAYGLYNLPSEPWHWSVNGQ